MSGLSFALTANNSDQDMSLLFYKQPDGTVSACLIGKYKGEYMQIDFNDLSIRDARELSNYINMAASDDGDSK